MCLQSPSTSTKPEDRPTLTHGLIIGYGISRTVDLALTEFMQGAGFATEGNPLSKWASDGPVKFGLFQGAVTAGTIYALMKAHKWNPRLTRWLTAGLIGLQIWIDARNYRLFQEMRR